MRPNVEDKLRKHLDWYEIASERTLKSLDNELKKWCTNMVLEVYSEQLNPYRVIDVDDPVNGALETEISDFFWTVFARLKLDVISSLSGQCETFTRVPLEAMPGWERRAEDHAWERIKRRLDTRDINHKPHVLADEADLTSELRRTSDLVDELRDKVAELEDELQGAHDAYREAEEYRED
jgi:hypothetical protein